MRKEYYIVMQRGLPHEVYSNPFKAEEAARQLSTKDAQATVLAVVPAQLELPLPDPEANSDTTMPCWECNRKACKCP